VFYFRHKISGSVVAPFIQTELWFIQIVKTAAAHGKALWKIGPVRNLVLLLLGVHFAVTHGHCCISLSMIAQLLF
jgi:hypothetical protein